MTTSTIASIFQSMDYSSATEDISIAKAWLSTHKSMFGDFVENENKTDHTCSVEAFTAPNGELLANIHNQGIQDDSKVLTESIDSFSKSFSHWSSLSCHARARHLYSIARQLQKNCKLLATVGALCGVPIRTMKNTIVPRMIQHFYYYAGVAQLMGSTLQDYEPKGVFMVIQGISNDACLFGPILAAGNIVCMKSYQGNHIFGFLIAEICAKAGMPPGVVNALTGNFLVDQVCAPSNSTPASQAMEITTITDGSCSIHAKNIVYDSADIDSAVETIVHSTFIGGDRGSTVFAQQSIYKEVIKKLKGRMDKLRVGTLLDNNADILDNVGLSVGEYNAFLKFAGEKGAEIYTIDGSAEIRPTLITGIEVTSGFDLNNIDWPVVVAVPFRTSKEAVSLCNNTVDKFNAAIFTEKLPLAIEAAKLIKAETIWINCANLFDAGGSSVCRDGSIGGADIIEFLRPNWQKAKPKTRLPVSDASVATYLPEALPAGNINQLQNDQKVMSDVDVRFKLYYGGAQKQPDAGHYRSIMDSDGGRLADVPQASSKDLLNAVEAAQKAQPSWENRTGFNRSQILYYLAENLDQRKDEMKLHLVKYPNITEDSAGREVEAAIERLFYWAAFADKYGGDVLETPMSGVVAKLHGALGVVGIVCPEEAPLLAFVSLFAPAVARGNAVVIVPSEKCPTPALKFYQLLDTSDVPGGVINILSGSSYNLTKNLHQNRDVQAIWYFGTPKGVEFMTDAAIGQREEWLNCQGERDWFDSKQGQGIEFQHYSTHIKRVWMPMGETFAN